MAFSTTSGNRIESIDVLRGFALAGILYTHMIIWYTGAALPQGVYAAYDTVADGIAMGIFGALALGKFFSVFSFLFGLSFYLHLRKNKGKPGHLWIYLWRLFLLFLIGVAHHALWRGDILAIYAFLGVLLVLVRRLPSSVLLILSLVLVTNLPTHLYEAFATGMATAEMDLPQAERASRYYEVVQNADLFRVVKDNWASWPAKIKYQLESGRLFMTFGYFLLGFYAGRTELFESIGENILRFKSWNKYTARMIAFLLFIGFLMYYTGVASLPEIAIVPEFRWLASFLFSIYNTCVSLFYITGITLLLRKDFYYPLLIPLAPMGRMALTNYLLQTAFGLLLFYDFGLDLFDKSPPSLNVVLAVLVLWLQLKFSQWWLSRYRQGPVEWLWKSLTRMSRLVLPMR